MNHQDPRDFFTNNAKPAIELHFVGRRGFTRWKGGLTKSENRWLDEHGFCGEADSNSSLPGTAGALKAVVIGLGDVSLTDASPQDFARMFGALKGGTYVLGGRIPNAAKESLALGWALSNYAFRAYLQGSGPSPRILISPPGVKLTRIAAIASGVFMARDMINTPAEDMGPSGIQDVAESVAETFGARIESVVGDDLLTENFPTIHAVGRAAADAPRLIELNWSGAKRGPKITLVGKGISFDSGGLDIKSAGNMRLMKKDMGGSAVALSLARTIMELKLPVNLRVLLASAENAISGNAFRPGDIIKTRKGLTVEIDNTDAEGRLVLCDALAYAAEDKPDFLLDFATLTGAARIALGPDLPAFFTRDEGFAASLTTAAEDAGDPVWRLPLWSKYLSMLNSNVADMCNSGGAFAGSITAALYLECFVDGAKTWGHFDIYGWNPNGAPGWPQGGEASALRGVLNWLEQQTQKRR